MTKFKHPFNDSLNKILTRLEELLKYQKLQKSINPEYKLLDNAEVLQLFKITQKTAASWRDEGILPYVKINMKYYYKLKDIEKMIDKHYNPIKKK